MEFNYTPQHPYTSSWISLPLMFSYLINSVESEGKPIQLSRPIRPLGNCPSSATIEISFP